MQHLRHGVALLQQVVGQARHREDLDGEGGDGGLSLLVITVEILHYCLVVISKDDGQLSFGLVILHEAVYHQLQPQASDL